jgi:ubiquinone biosynthesis protein COQ4
MMTSLPVPTAIRSLLAVLRDPNDASHVFRIVDALAGRTPARFRRAWARSASGARLLAERPRLRSVLEDTERLRALPEGSLGRAYLAFMERDRLDAAYLDHAQAVAGVDHASDEDAYIDARLRDSHDLWHVVTGYGGDLLGEASLLAFTYAQTWSRGVGLIASVGLLRADDPDARRLIVDAFVRGLRAAWLPAVAWEDWLAAPLADVRTRLRVGPPPAYEPFFASDLPPGGLLARDASVMRAKVTVPAPLPA